MAIQSLLTSQTTCANLQVAVEQLLSKKRHWFYSTFIRHKAGIGCHL